MHAQDEEFLRIRDRQLPGISVFRTPLVFDANDYQYFQKVSKFCYQTTLDLIESRQVPMGTYAKDLPAKWTTEIFRADLIYNRDLKKGQIIELNFGDPSGAGVMEAVYECFFALDESRPYEKLKRDQVASDIAQSIKRFQIEYLHQTPKDRPHLFLGMPKHASVYYDFEILQRCWRSEFVTHLGDPKDLAWDGKNFLFGDQSLDCLYRDYFDDWCSEGTQDFLPEVKRALIKAPRLPILSPFESGDLDSKEHLPLYAKAAEDAGETYFANTWRPEDPELIIRDQNKLVLKNYHGYGGYDVHIGPFTDPLAWKNLVREKLGSHYVVQDYVALPKESLEIMTTEGAKRADYSVLLSLWVVGGRYSGCIVRASQSPVINVHQNCGFAPVFYAN